MFESADFDAAVPLNFEQVKNHCADITRLNAQHRKAENESPPCRFHGTLKLNSPAGATTVPRFLRTGSARTICEHTWGFLPSEAVPGLFPWRVAPKPQPNLPLIHHFPPLHLSSEETSRCYVRKCRASKTAS